MLAPTPPVHVPPAAPALSALSVPSSAPAGRPPRVTLRIDERGVRIVYVQVTIAEPAMHTTPVVVKLGWVPTGRTLLVKWPSGARLAPGAYEVSVRAHDPRRVELTRSAHSSGVAGLTVTGASKLARSAPPASVPAPTPAAPPVVLEAGVPTPEQTVADGAVFPVAGPHNFGGPENVFGAPRDGYTHQGQDILTAEGTPVLAPLAGAILTTSYQAEGAGYYAVERTTVGFDFMFAHCQAQSLLVGTAQTVTAGQQLCSAGQTGDATAPHLDFEMWLGGWQAATGHPIDPLPYLEAWEHDASR
jgi:murein DD-endopeptidase MepM/ murein hydrolase activator NlpD